MIVHDTIIQKLRDILAHQILHLEDLDAIGNTDGFLEEVVGLHSLQMCQFVLCVEREFDINFTSTDFDNLDFHNFISFGNAVFTKLNN